MEGKGSILLVEDNADDEALTRRAYRKTGRPERFDIARDGQAALDYLFGTGGSSEAGPRHPDLILLDLKLPKIDGIEVLRRIREDERTRLIPVVVVSSSIDENDLHRCYSLGANSYIRKVVDFSAFIETLAVLTRYWLEINQAPQLGDH